MPRKPLIRPVVSLRTSDRKHAPYVETVAYTNVMFRMVGQADVNSLGLIPLRSIRFNGEHECRVAVKIPHPWEGSPVGGLSELLR